MTNPLNNLKQAADALRLSQTEKDTMRAALRAQMAAGAAPQPTATPGPVHSPYQWFFAPRMLAPVLMVAVVLVGAGTASAAQGALPGDLLYPVKISVNEQVEVALARTGAQRADVAVRHAERRVNEAQALAASGRLTAEVAEDLAARLESQADLAVALADSLEREDPGSASEVKVRLFSSLAVNGAILATLGGEGDTPSATQSNTLAVRVIARAQGSDTVAFGSADASFAKAEPASADAAVSLMMATEPTMEGAPEAARMATTGGVDDDTQQRVALRMQSQATGALGEARSQFRKVQAKLTATTTARVEAQLTTVGEYLRGGSAALEASNPHEAVRYFTSALKLSVNLKALLLAQQRFERDIITPLLNVHMDAGDILPLPMPVVDTGRGGTSGTTTATSSTRVDIRVGSTTDAEVEVHTEVRTGGGTSGSVNIDIEEVFDVLPLRF